MQEDVIGIVISEQSYSDSSKIINLYTKKYGIIGLMVKGAKSLKSPLRSVSTKLTYGIFTIYYKKDKLSILKEANVLNNFNQIRKDITLISYASYLVELAKQVYKESLEEGVFDILINALIKINDGFACSVITNIVELKYLDFLGVLPIIDRCAICGCKNNIVTLSSDKGGYLCFNCHTNEPLISEKSIKLIRLYYYVDILKIDKLEINKKNIEEINNFLNLYYDRYTGIYLNSKKFLSNIIEI